MPKSYSLTCVSHVPAIPRVQIKFKTATHSQATLLMVDVGSSIS